MQNSTAKYSTSGWLKKSHPKGNGTTLPFTNAVKGKNPTMPFTAKQARTLTEENNKASVQSKHFVEHLCLEAVKREAAQGDSSTIVIWEGATRNGITQATDKLKGLGFDVSVEVDTQENRRVFYICW